MFIPVIVNLFGFDPAIQPAKKLRLLNKEYQSVFSIFPRETKELQVKNAPEECG